MLFGMLGRVVWTAVHRPLAQALAAWDQEQRDPKHLASRRARRQRSVRQRGPRVLPQRVPYTDEELGQPDPRGQAQADHLARQRAKRLVLTLALLIALSGLVVGVKATWQGLFWWQGLVGFGIALFGLESAWAELRGARAPGLQLPHPQASAPRSVESTPSTST